MNPLNDGDVAIGILAFLAGAFVVYIILSRRRTTITEITRDEKGHVISIMEKML